MKIRNVKYTYLDGKYKLGPYMDFYAELEVVDAGYDSVVRSICQLHPEYEEVRVMSFER